MCATLLVTERRWSTYRMGYATSSHGDVTAILNPWYLCVCQLCATPICIWIFTCVNRRYGKWMMIEIGIIWYIFVWARARSDLTVHSIRLLSHSSWPSWIIQNFQYPPCKQHDFIHVVFYCCCLAVVVMPRFLCRVLLNIQIGILIATRIDGDGDQG